MPSDPQAGSPPRSRPRALAGLLLALLLAGTAVGAEGDPPAVLDAVFAGERQTIALEALETRPALGPGESLRAVEIARDASSSHHVVAIRDGETPHRHERHDLLVHLLEGHGTMQLGDVARRVGQGSVFWVPRGTLHAFRNGSEAPAVAYVVYFPPFDGKDRVVEED
jgi:quercetin dioxygenase-like cupin family protein